MITTKAIPKNTGMKTNTAKFLPIAEKFFTAYDARDVDGRVPHPSRFWFMRRVGV